MAKNPVRITCFLKHCGPDGNRLLDAVSEHRRTLFTVHEALPEYIRKHCVHSLVKNSTLILFADSSAACARLRFYAAQIFTPRMRGASPMEFDAIRVRVCAPYPLPPPPARAPNIPSPKITNLIRNSAQAAAAADLERSLLRLAESIEKQRHKQGQGAN